MSLKEKMSDQRKSSPGQSAFGRRAQIWHAFNALDGQKKGEGELQKSQLKVLSHNLIAGLSLNQSENAIDEFMPSSTSLSFSDYMRFIDGILSDLQSKAAEDHSLFMETLDRICWFICSKSYMSQTEKFLEENNCFKLWCIFNILAHADADGEPVCPVNMDFEEVEILLQRVYRIVGMIFRKEFFQQLVNANGQSFSFPQLLKVLEKSLFGLDLTVVNNVISELYDEYVLGVLKKGYLTKKGHFIMNWKERWCVLTRNSLRYFVSRDEKELRGEIKITAKCTIENLSDKIGSKPNRLLLKSEDKVYEISVPDMITKNEWFAAFVAAVNFHKDSGTTDLTKEEIRQRRISRLTRRAKLTEEQTQKLRQKELMEMTQQQLEQEMMRRLEMEKKMREEEEKRLRDQELMAKTREELEAIKMARTEAESRWAQEAAELEREKDHLKELQELHKQLQIQLEKERQAREQEEISRKRQEEITNEEMLKKKELEQMQLSLEKLLLNEKQKREDLEEARQQQESLLRDEKLRLEQLENERMQRNLEYEMALEKLHQAELEKEEAHRLLRKKKESPFGSALYKFVESEANDLILVNPGSHRGKGFLGDNN